MGQDQDLLGQSAAANMALLVQFTYLVHFVINLFSFSLDVFKIVFLKSFKLKGKM